MKPIRHIIAKLSLLFCACSITCDITCAEEAKDPFAADAEIAMPMTPDYLVPLHPYPSDKMIDYTKQLTKHLGLEEDYLARMIVRPSFGAEYCMRVHGDTNSNAFDDTKEYFVSCRISDKSIWYSMPSNNDEKLQKPINPQSLKASLPTATARRVCAIWKAMILRARYPEDGSGGLDGVTIEFASQHGHGEAWSPTDGTSPALLWDLGEKLIEYCKASDEAKKAALEAINKSADTIEEYLKKSNKPRHDNHYQPSR